MLGRGLPVCAVVRVGNIEALLMIVVAISAVSAVGALLAGIIADLISIEAAIYAVAALTAASGLVVIVRMYETHPVDRRTQPTPS